MAIEMYDTYMHTHACTHAHKAKSAGSHKPTLNFSNWIFETNNIIWIQHIQMYQVYGVWSKAKM